MIRFIFSFLILLILTWPVHADEVLKGGDNKQEAVTRAINVPIVTFAQKVAVVVEMKKNPGVLQAVINQEDNIITMDLVVRNTQTRKQAKELGVQFIRMLKEKSLDDNPDPKSEALGKGLYRYEVKVARANTDVMADGVKKADKTVVDWAIDGEEE